MDINIKIKVKNELHIMDIFNQKPNYAELARKYDVDYRTVKKYHEGYEGKPKSRDKPSKLDAFKDEIMEKLNIPRTTKKGVYEWLVDKYGFEKVGSYSNFKVYCSKNKLKRSPNGSGGGTRFETEAGELAECDWKENIQLVSRNGEKFIVNIFHLVLKFSRYSYLELTLSREQSVVFRCLINAFKFYGGVPHRILFDNMSTVIDTTVKPKKINIKMVQFAKDIGFKVDSCKPRRPFTKGTNEARNKILDWIRPYNNEFETFDDLQNIVDKINQKMNMELCSGIDMKPCILFYKEKEYLYPLADTTIIDEYLAPTKVKVSNQQLITYKGNKYSVDKKYVDEYVFLEEFENKLQIYYKGKLIQIHQLSDKPINYSEEHYKQSISNTIKQQDIDDIARHNLNIFDNLLAERTVVVTKEDACKSRAGMIAYLMSQGAESNAVSRIIYSLSKEERNILLAELKKLLPYVTNEDQFFLAFKHVVRNKCSMKHIRLDFWELDLMECYDFLSQEGYDSINKDFEKECNERLKTMKDRWE